LLISGITEGMTGSSFGRPAQETVPNKRMSQNVILFIDI